MVRKLYLKKVVIKIQKRNGVRVIEKILGKEKGLEFQSHWLCGPEQIATSLCISDSPTIK